MILILACGSLRVYPRVLRTSMSSKLFGHAACLAVSLPKLFGHAACLAVSLPKHTGVYLSTVVNKPFISERLKTAPITAQLFTPQLWRETMSHASRRDTHTHTQTTFLQCFPIVHCVSSYVTHDGLFCPTSTDGL